MIHLKGDLINVLQFFFIILKLWIAMDTVKLYFITVQIYFRDCIASIFTCYKVF